MTHYIYYDNLLQVNLSNNFSGDLNMAKILNEEVIFTRTCKCCGGVWVPRKRILNNVLGVKVWHGIKKGVRKVENKKGNIGGLWLKTSKVGNKFMSGSIETKEKTSICSVQKHT